MELVKSSGSGSFGGNLAFHVRARVSGDEVRSGHDLAGFWPAAHF
jgi:hypothetical protein